jgi:hypothetical protein
MRVHVASPESRPIHTCRAYRLHILNTNAHSGRWLARGFLDFFSGASSLYMQTSSAHILGVLYLESGISNALLSIVSIPF